MNKTIVKENILRQLELIVEQNNNLNAYSGKIPIIDLDIIKANIRKLYEQIYDLEKANQAIDHFEQNIIKDNTQEVIAEIKETPEKPLVIVNNQPIIEEIKPIQVSEKEKEEEEEEVHLISIFKFETSIHNNNVVSNFDK
jgi:hypothetical protein